MRALLVRVAADQSEGGGHWNGPVDSKTHRFAYVAIPESAETHPGLGKPYEDLTQVLDEFGERLPPHLTHRHMHLDPDFDHLTYGDVGERGKQIRTKLGAGDLIVFYAGMRDVNRAPGLVYALIGLYVVDEIVEAKSIPKERQHENAHTRRILRSGATDIVVRGRSSVSGRFDRYIPIGSYRDRAYRVWPELLEAWGGLSVKDGYLQRSARLPEFSHAEQFYTWIKDQGVSLMQRNN